MKKLKEEDTVQHSPEGHRGQCMHLQDEKRGGPSTCRRRWETGKKSLWTRKGCFGIHSCLKHWENFDAWAEKGRKTLKKTWKLS